MCVHTHRAGRTPALQQFWQSLEKSQNVKEKTQYLLNTLYVMVVCADVYVCLSVRESVHITVGSLKDFDTDLLTIVLTHLKVQVRI